MQEEFLYFTYNPPPPPPTPETLSHNPHRRIVRWSSLPVSYSYYSLPQELNNQEVFLYFTYHLPYSALPQHIVRWSFLPTAHSLHSPASEVRFAGGVSLFYLHLPPPPEVLSHNPHRRIVRLSCFIFILLNPSLCSALPQHIVGWSFLPAAHRHYSPASGVTWPGGVSLFYLPPLPHPVLPSPTHCEVVICACRPQPPLSCLRS